MRATATVIPRLEPERDMGNVEYKLLLKFPNQWQFEKRKTQMLFRVEEGDGEAVYCLGVMDDGSCVGIEYTEMLQSENNLIRLADALGLVVSFTRHLTTVSPHLFAREYKITRSSSMQ